MNGELSQTVRVRDKHEITIPKNIRNHLQIKTGDLMELEAKPNGQIYIHKIKTVRVEPDNGNGGNGAFSTTTQTSDPISPPTQKTEKKDQT